MGYRNSALYTLKYVAAMLNEDEDFLRSALLSTPSHTGANVSTLRASATVA